MTTIEDMLKFADENRFCVGCGKKVTLMYEASTYDPRTGAANKWYYGLQCPDRLMLGHTYSIAWTIYLDELNRFIEYVRNQNDQS